MLRTVYLALYILLILLVYAIGMYFGLKAWQTFTLFFISSITTLLWEEDWK